MPINRHLQRSIKIDKSHTIKSIGWRAFGYFGDNSGGYSKYPGFVIYGQSGSAAETYAVGDGFTFQLILDDNPSQGGESQKDISKAVLALENTSYTYDGEEKKPSVTVELDGKTLVQGTDYTVAYSNNIEVGTAEVTVTGRGNYTGSKTESFTISKPDDTEAPVKADIAQAAVTLDKTSYTYDGKAKTPSVTVKLDGKTLVLNTDYTVSYSDNINVGTAKVTVTGKGSYIW